MRSEIITRVDNLKVARIVKILVLDKNDKATGEFKLLSVFLRLIIRFKLAKMAVILLLEAL